MRLYGPLGDIFKFEKTVAATGAVLAVTASLSNDTKLRTVITLFLFTEVKK